MQGKLLAQQKQYRWLSIAGLLLLLCCLFMQVVSSQDSRYSDPLGRIDAVLYDWRFRLLMPQREALPGIVIVDLDELTQQREGRWPWDRAKVAQLIDAMRSHGAAIVGFDVVFSEAGSNPAVQLKDSQRLSPSVRQALSEQAVHFDGDAILAASLDPFVVLGYFFHADGASAGMLPPPFLILQPEAAQFATILSLPDYTASLPVLTESGAGGGFVVAIPDGDGIVRRVPLVLRYEDGVYASLTLEMARLALNAPWLRLGMSEQGGNNAVTHVQVGRQVQIPLDATGNMLVPYRGTARSYPTISATHILQGDAPEGQLAALENAIVLVGTSALGLADLRTMPLQTAFPGVEVHANALDAMLQAALGEDTLYTQPDWAPGAVLLMLAVVGLFLIVVMPGRSPRMMLMLAALCLAGVVVLNAVLWYHAHLALPMASLLILVVLLSGLHITAGYLTSNRQKQSIQRLFGEYVPASYVERMVEQPESVNLSGEQRDMTVLFADVRSFTSISEHLTASELKVLLNRYLSSVTEVIFAHQGTIDKYVGDMVMAFWNAPLDDKDHAFHAIAAALGMQERMHMLRREFAAEGLPEIRIGIGLNTGSMNVGDMGSSYRRAYTVLGDAVNLGSRLEGLTAFYKVPVLVSSMTKAQAPGFLYRTVDLVRVKGKQEAVGIYEPLCAIGEATDVLKERVTRFEEALEDYRQRRWDKARRILLQLQEDDPDYAFLYGIYLARMQELDPASLPDDWDGVYTHTGK